MAPLAIPAGSPTPERAAAKPTTTAAAAIIHSIVLFVSAQAAISAAMDGVPPG